MYARRFSGSFLSKYLPVSSIVLAKCKVFVEPSEEPRNGAYMNKYWSSENRSCSWFPRVFSRSAHLPSGGKQFEMRPPASLPAWTGLGVTLLRDRTRVPGQVTSCLFGFSQLIHVWKTRIWQVETPRSHEVVHFTHTRNQCQNQTLELWVSGMETRP